MTAPIYATCTPAPQAASSAEHFRDVLRHPQQTQLPKLEWEPRVPIHSPVPQTTKPLAGMTPWIHNVATAQKTLDCILSLASSGKSFSAGELLSLQAQIYCSSQQLDFAGKVVEKGSAAVRQVLQTQV